MNVRRNGIAIDDGTLGKLTVAKVNAYKQQKYKRYDRYVEMQHIVDKYQSVVTPFDKAYIKQLKREGYKLVDDFKIHRIGG